MSPVLMSPQKYNAVIRIANIIHKAKGKTTENDEVFSSLLNKVQLSNFQT